MEIQSIIDNLELYYYNNIKDKIELDDINEKVNEKIKSIKNTISETDTENILESINQSNEEIGYYKKETEHSLLKELYLYDRDLFKYNTNIANDIYSRSCQIEKYPVVISPDKVRNLDLNYPK